MKHATALAQLARYVLTPAIWTAETEAAARRLPSDSPEWNSTWLRAEVASGRAKVCDIVREGERIGWVVFTVSDASELILMAAFGRDGRTNLTSVILERADVLARQCECVGLRLHTMRPGAIKKAMACGYHVSEIVMRKPVR